MREQYAAVGAAAKRLLRKQSRLSSILHRRMAMPCLSSRNISNGLKPRSFISILIGATAGWFSPSAI